MGSDKAFLQLGETSLLAHALRLAAQVCNSVKVVGQSEKFSGYAETISDIYTGHGPLGGIHAALRSSSTALNLILAVDMPQIAPDFLRYLVQQAFATDALVTVPCVNGRFQPLCAVYRDSFAALAERSLAQGRNKIDPLFAPEVTRIITRDEIERLAFPLSMFDNLNTREELDRARTEAKQR